MIYIVNIYVGVDIDCKQNAKLLYISKKITYSHITTVGLVSVLLMLSTSPINLNRDVIGGASDGFH